MPHLDLTYFLNQSLWCISIFLLVYFTAGKYFSSKLFNGLNNRKKVIYYHIYDSKKLFSKIKQINEKIEYFKNNLKVDVKRREKQLRSKIFYFKVQYSDLLREEIVNKNIAHKIFLNKIKKILIKDLNKEFINLEDDLNRYLFYKDE